MKAIDLRKDSTLGNGIINPELYLQLYPLDDNIFQKPQLKPTKKVTFCPEFEDKSEDNKGNLF